MSELQLFKGKGNELANSELFKSLQTMNDNLGANSFGTSRRISIRGAKFREIVNGEQIKVNKSDTMNIIIIDAAPVSRTFYEGAYDPDNVVAPMCWSANTETPSDDVIADDKQSTRCGDCPQNIKGSGQGQTRACRYSQRLAVVVEGHMDKVYQLQLPATSIFGEAKESEMPMQGYARFLQAHNTPAIAVVTEMRFDEDADVPKLYFKAIRPLEQDELETAVELRDHEDTHNAITFKVFETDKGGDAQPKKEEAAEDTEAAEKKAKAAKAKAARAKAKADKAAAEAEEAEEPEEVEEPTKVESKDEETPETESDLASVISGWDD